jgi:hypothetical protein
VAAFDVKLREIGSAPIRFVPGQASSSTAWRLRFSLPFLHALDEQRSCPLAELLNPSGDRREATLEVIDQRKM